MIIPSWAKYIGTDASGAVYAFEDMPDFDDGGFWPVTGRLECLVPASAPKLQEVIRHGHNDYTLKDITP